ncbi:MAG: 2OG-Fe(II) oxygenase, partial [Proteobacteria bacterium]|nr:2OG-Fe(II) oxygenase [Pseudomonadota bacterium]
PEYGPQLYQPEVGGAVVFSCSLLHEATRVTSGRRFVLLGFFYGEAEQALRDRIAAERKAGGAGSPASRPAR